MHFEIRSLVFDNLLTYETKQLRTDWQEGIFVMEDFTLAEGVYKNGPIFFSLAPEEMKGGLVILRIICPLTTRLHWRKMNTFHLSILFILKRHWFYDKRIN